MDWGVTIHFPEIVTYPDKKTYSEERIEQYVIPYKAHQNVYYAFKKRRKWALKKRYVKGMWATNTYGVILSDNHLISREEFDKLFTDEGEATDFCLKQNQRAKVKIYY